MNEKRKWGTAGRLRRGAVILGVMGLTAGAAVMTAGSALAGVGTQPGNLSLSPASGAANLNPAPTWSTSDGCPAAEQVSAEISVFTTSGTLVTRFSPVVSSGLTAGFSGTLDGTIAALFNTAGLGSTGGTLEFVVECYAGAGGTGTAAPTQSTFVTVNSAGNFTTSATGPVIIGTTTNLTATPNPVAINGTVTLTANVSGSDGSSPAGTVQFEVNGTNLGTPVNVNTGGTAAAATTTTTFSSAGNEALSAVFVPTSTTTYAGSTGTFALAVGSLLATGTNPVPVTVQVPATGTLSVSVATGSVTLTPQATTPDETATGNMNQVQVSDTRNSFPGWSVAGQESAFTEAAPGTATIPASSLGWTPAFVGSAVGGATIGAAVAPVGANTGSSGPGLGTAATLASATPGNGFGTNTLSAALLLDIPSATPPGAYSGNLTITYVTAGP
jgi:hypothetical protein